MTIKRRLFFSNIRMALVTIGGSIIAFLTIRIILSAIFGSWRFFDRPDIELFSNPAWDSLILFVYLVVFAVFICIINIILTSRMTKKITMPLETLDRGVKQIYENNFAYRINYNDDDEFRPVCEAFNQMAAQLEASAEQRLKDEANRRELLAGISHDLRTPLTTIKGYLEGLEMGVASTTEMRTKYFGTIKNKTTGMEHIIERLFLFSKLDMDEFPLAPRRVDIMRVISDMVEGLAEEYANRGLDIHITGSPGNVFVFVDTVFLRNALVNILENSVMYKTKEIGRMEINACIANGKDSKAVDTACTDFIQIAFIDDGPGVSPDSLPKLFDAFYRADQSRHTKGSGLGLAISAKIVERSGGSIRAENSDSGGFVIVINLPIEKGVV